MQAIQTSYKGYNFRSRLEARWAVFFDALGLDWQYEVEGFQLDSGAMYLPDFVIDIHTYDDVYDEITFKYYNRVYAEVKPKGITHDYKFDEFCRCMPEFSPETFIEIDGVKCAVQYDIHKYLLSGDPMDMLLASDNYLDDFTMFIGRLGYVGKLNNRMEHLPNELVLAAANKARSARFEHGESGGATKFDRTVAMIESWKAKWREEVK